jgi:hypothetical protein
LANAVHLVSPSPPFPLHSIYHYMLSLPSLGFYSRNNFKVWRWVSALSSEIKPEVILFEDVIPWVYDGFFFRDSGIGRLTLFDSLYSISFGGKVSSYLKHLKWHYKCQKIVKPFD